MRVFSTSRQRFYGLLSGLLAVLVVVLIALAGPIHRQLDAWKVLPQPERLTELYYTDHTKLPTTYLPGTSQSFRFTVHNLEYRDTNYRYVVGQASADGTGATVITSGDFNLSQDAAQTVTVNFTPTYHGDRSRVDVSLTNRQTNQRQSIHYYVASLVSAEQYQAQQQAAL